jgi:hypothetical protein
VLAEVDALPPPAVLKTVFGAGDPPDEQALSTSASTAARATASPVERS